MKGLKIGTFVMFMNETDYPVEIYSYIVSKNEECKLC